MKAAATATDGWQLACPDCRVPVDGTCPRCGRTMAVVDGIWRGIRAADEDAVAAFLADYTLIRHAEGRGSDDPAYYRALPRTPPDDPLAWQWAMRARTWSFVERHLVARWPPGQRVVDAGAGVGWVANRLAALGHHPVAVDVSVDERDGLGATCHLDHRWPAVQATLDRLPLAEGQADVVIYNASFHYTTDAAVTLAEARRVLRPGGAVVVLDTPVYRHDGAGRLMVAERHAQFEARYGTRSDSMPSIEYLTRHGLDDLAARLPMSWSSRRPWYGWRWAARPWVARARRRRPPSRFLVLEGRFSAGDADAGP